MNGGFFYNESMERAFEIIKLHFLNLYSEMNRVWFLSPCQFLGCVFKGCRKTVGFLWWGFLDSRFLSVQLSIPEGNRGLNDSLIFNLCK